MAIDPRTFLVTNCEKSQQTQKQTTSQKSDFLSSIENIGNLEVLNDVGYGKVAEGLRVLVKTSDSIRTGSLLASTLGSDANGADYVLSTVGIPPNSVQQAASLNSNVANRAYGQAKSIYSKVKQGNYQLTDIPGSFSDLQNLSTLLDNTFVDPKPPEQRDFQACGASPYAVDLISWAPKYKFLFVVQLEFTEPYSQQFKDIQAAFVVKNSTRPNVNFDYEEVNMYNFWTRVPKRTIYEPMTMRFYDDNKNQAMALYNAYLRAMSPISNLPFDQKMEDVSGILESTSMDFSGLNQGVAFPGAVPTHKYSASYGPTAGPDTKNIFKRITLFHVYREGQLMNVYKFYNPKILTMELDDLDMADNGGGNEISFQFAYDGLNVITGYQVSDTTDYDITALSGASVGASYPLRYNGEFDAAVTDPNQPPGQQQNSISAAITETLDSARSTISDAFNSASDYIGSQFL